MKHFLSLKELSKGQIIDLIHQGQRIKTKPEKYNTKLKNKTLLMFFEKPSLRTRLSFQVGMTQLGGNSIYYNLQGSYIGEKESIKDATKTSSRYVDIITARLYEHSKLIEMANNASVPIINGLTSLLHPCQVLADLMTIIEKFSNFNIKLAYIGDANNNVTHSLINAANIIGFEMAIACPKKISYIPHVPIKNVKIYNSPEKAVKNAEIIYTDSWMSYHIPEKEKTKRIKDLKKFQVTSSLLKKASPRVVFMHCLPALRGYEVTKEVIDGSKSIIFDQAENRLHIQKALMLKLLNKI